MKKAPGRLALFMILISIGRVAAYVAEGLHVGFSGYLFAIGLAYGVYLSFYYLQWKETRLPAIAGVAIFTLADLWFNEFELIRILSSKELVMESGNFLGIEAKYLEIGMQISALTFGAAPTLAAAVLGWLQSGADKLSDKDMGIKPSPFARVWKAIAGMFAGIAVSFAVYVEGTAFARQGLSQSAGGTSDNLPIKDGEVTELSGPKRWKDLNADDVAFILVAGRGQIAQKYLVSERTGGNWKADLLAGKKPWENARNLPEPAEK